MVTAASFVTDLALRDENVTTSATFIDTKVIWGLLHHKVSRGDCRVIQNMTWRNLQSNFDSRYTGKIVAQPRTQK